MKGKKLLTLLVMICLVVLTASLSFAASCAKEEAAPSPAPAPAPTPPAKDKIVIGMSRSLSGPIAVIGQTSFDPAFKMWVEEVNAAGGIYVAEYGKKLLVEPIIYDDKSDRGTMVKLLEKLITEDKVDFVMGPVGTGQLFAAAPIANKHEYILIGAEGGSITLREFLPSMPYVFPTIQDAMAQVPPLVEVLKEKGVKTAAVIYFEDLHGVENASTTVTECRKAGIDIVMYKSFPPGTKDLSPLLREAKALNVDAFLSMSYPDESFLAIRQSIEIDFNPKAWFATVGIYINVIKSIFTNEQIEGVMGGGAWNGKQSPRAAELEAKRLAITGPDGMEYWGFPVYWSSLQALQQAIEKAGSLDQAKIRDILATEKFQTDFGPWWWENQVPANEAYVGLIGQWQNGYFEVICPKDKATAEPIFPKPAWPR
ncbi:MAG TPA: amino acid ABC transporter substrate-binding protein [Dehalococcoidales bacterium]|nr:amino acid ABC transporter substrate-binding protein [Dehalococcoidales bacterium]